MESMTSDSHPIHVDFISAEHLRKPIRLGLTIAPGRKEKKPNGEHYDRDLDKDLKRLKQFYNTDLIISLLEEDELGLLCIPDLLKKIHEYDMASIWIPIKDLLAPASIGRFAESITNITDSLERGRTVVIHCKGGRGRSGLVAASCLIATERVSSTHAIELVRLFRSGAVETDAQVAFLKEFELLLKVKKG